MVVSRKQTHSLYYPNSPWELSSFSLRKQAKEPIYAMFHKVKPIEFSVNSHRKKHYFQNFLPFSKKLSYLCPRTLAASLRGGTSVTFVGKKEISVCCLFNNVRETWRWKERGNRVTVDAHVMWALLHLLSQVSAKYLRTRCGSSVHFLYCVRFLAETVLSGFACLLVWWCPIIKL